MAFIGPIALLTAMAIGVICLNVSHYRLTHNGQWHFCAASPQMKRFIAGHWQYRPRTESEDLEWLYRNVW